MEEWQLATPCVIWVFLFVVKKRISSMERPLENHEDPWQSSKTTRHPYAGRGVLSALAGLAGLWWKNDQ